MRKLLLFLSLILLVGCSSEDPDPSILLTDSTTTYQVGFRADETVELEFTSTTPWIISKVPEGLNISMTSGKKGTHKLVVKTTAANSTNETKKHTFTITGAYEDKQDQKTITIEQISAFTMEKTTYKIDAEGGKIDVVFTYNGDEPYSGSNLPPLGLLHDTEEGPVMIGDDTDTNSAPELGKTRSIKLVWSIPVRKNTSKETRSCSLWIALMDPNNKDSMEGVVATTTEFVFVQTGTDYEEREVDYTNDGKVSILQTHTKGQGIPVVLTGDGFLDTHVDAGTFDDVMKMGYQYLFSVEPMKSLKDYFDVYSVVAVSKENHFTAHSETAFNLRFSSETTEVTGDRDRIMSYVQKVEGLSPDQSNKTAHFKYYNTLVIVIANVDRYAGTCEVHLSSALSGVSTGFSIAYVPMAVAKNHQGIGMENLLHHEAIGHGFGRLDDEYSYVESGRISEEEQKDLEKKYELMAYLNTDVKSDVKQTHWAKLAADEHFKAESLGAYEGGHTFYKGVYRPTRTSIMDDNTGGFNAPSRELIYKRAMMIANGGEFTYKYEDFLAFDQPTWSTYGNTRGVNPWQESKKHDLPPLARPRVIYGD